MALHNRTRFYTISLITFLLSISNPVMAGPLGAQGWNAGDPSGGIPADGMPFPDESYRLLAQAVPGMETLDPSRGSVSDGQDVAPWDVPNTDSEESDAVLNIHKPEKSDSLVPYYKYFTAGSLSRATPVGTLLEIISGKTKVSAMDWVYIDIGSSQNVKVGDLFVVYSHDELIEHPLVDWKRVIGGKCVVADEFVFDVEPEEYDCSEYKGKFGDRKGIVEDREFFEDTADYDGILVNHLTDIDDDDIIPLIQINGSVVVREVSANMAKAQIHESFNLISKGDFLLPYPKHQQAMISSSYVPPKKNLMGYIAAIKDDFIMSATNDIVYLDKGSADGVSNGDRLEVYLIPQSVDEDVDSMDYEHDPFFSPTITATMPHVIGELVVINTLQDTSTALILNSRDPIVAGQKFRSAR